MKLLIISISFIFSCFCSFADTPNPPNNQNYQYGYNDKVGCNQVYDPYERMNRKIFILNSAFDKYFLRPVTIGYKNITNEYTKERVSSFVDNVTIPVTIVNYGLQANYNQTMKGVWRFIINTTFGIGGLFDVASKIGLDVKRQTFGSTLARYGVPPGPYIILPFLGPTNARDATDSLFTETHFNPIMYITGRNFQWTVFGLQTINSRLILLPFTDYVEKNSLDQYAAIKSTSHQNREAAVSYPKIFICPKQPN